MAVRPLHLNKRESATIVPFDAIEWNDAAWVSIHLCERSARHEKDGGVVELFPGPTWARGRSCCACRVGKVGEIRLHVPALGRVLARAPSELLLARGFLARKAPHRLRLAGLRGLETSEANFRR